METALRAGFIPPNLQVAVLQGHDQTPHSDTYNGELLDLSNGLVSSSPLKLNCQQLIDLQLPLAIDNSFLQLNETIVPHVKVFARISPENKARIVKIHKDAIQA